MTLDYPFDDEEEEPLEEQPRSSQGRTPAPQNTFVTQGEKKPLRKGIVVKVPKKLNWNPIKTGNTAAVSTAR